MVTGDVGTYEGRGSFFLTLPIGTDFIVVGERRKKDLSAFFEASVRLFIRAVSSLEEIFKACVFSECVPSFWVSSAQK